MSGLTYPYGVAVDGSGNVYIGADSGILEEWNASARATEHAGGTPFVPAFGVAVDGSGNVYLDECHDQPSAGEEIPYAFVSTTGLAENGAAGSDSLPAVLPSTAPLTGPFAPTSDQAWLTFKSITNGVVSFWFMNNPTTSHPAWRTSRCWASRSR